MDLQTVALFWIGVGTVLTGIGVLWFVTIYKEKQEYYRKLAAGFR